MPTRYNKTRKLINDSEYYRSLIKSRDVKRIEQYATPVLNNPTVAQRASLRKTKHIWKYGDRFYKLAHQYYGDERFWWVIAWYNAAPTEAHLKTGTVISIPLNIEKVLGVLGV